MPQVWISGFSNQNPCIPYKIFTKGVETGGGYCVSLEGSLLVSADFDIYSERLEGGRRAIAIGSEDYPNLYNKLYFRYYKKKVMTYIMYKKSQYKAPTKNYYATIDQGYKDCKLDKKYLKNALKRVL